MFKYLIVLFWCLWWLIALWTDIVGGMSYLGILHASWAPDSNYLFLVKSLQMYPVPTWIPALFYIGIIIFSGISFLLFLRACCSNFIQDPHNWLKKANLAFIFSTSYWLLFFLADQITMKFDLEQNHMVQGGFTLLCYLALHLLPNKDE